MLARSDWLIFYEKEIRMVKGLFIEMAHADVCNDVCSFGCKIAVKFYRASSFV